MCSYITFYANEIHHLSRLTPSSSFSFFFFFNYTVTLLYVAWRVSYESEGLKCHGSLLARVGDGNGNLHTVVLSLSRGLQS